jgi:hypothetical protein
VGNHHGERRLTGHVVSAMWSARRDQFLPQQLAC